MVKKKVITVVLDPALQTKVNEGMLAAASITFSLMAR
jgi:hypothetical protein